MSLRLILGRAGSGKSHLCLEEMRSQLLESPMGSPLIYLVPEQMTFQAEYELAQTPHLHGMLRAQVFSFRRLAWKVLQEVGGIARQHINSLGIKMVLRQVIEKHQPELRLFGRAAGQMGFTDQLESLYIELKRYMIDGARLEQQLQKLSAKVEDGPEYRLLADKLHDLHLIVQGVEHHLHGQYLDSEDYLRLLAEKIPYSTYIQEAEIWIDGFHGFTPQEYAVILALAAVAKRVSITLTLDRPYEATGRELDLFYPTGSTYLRLQELVAQIGTKVEEHIITAPPLRFRSPDLAHLEQHLDNRNGEKYEASPVGIKLRQAVNRRAEVEGVAREILHLVRDQGYRWRDIAILVRDMENYQDLISTIFTDDHIPIFLDQKRTMLHHPLIELLRSALEVIEHNWPTDAVLRCIKTDLLTPQVARAELDRLENYVLEYGINHYRWTDEAPWKLYSRTILKEEEQKRLEEESKQLNLLREQIVSPLSSLQKELHGEPTVREVCTAILQFLLELEVPGQLEVWADRAQESGRLEKAREHGQVWRSICDLLDQMVEVMGEEKYSLERYIKIFSSGLEGMHFALVPPSLDQVLVGTVERTRASHIRATFVLGVNDGIFPARPKEDGILFESERELLDQEGLELAPGSEKRLLEEEFSIYTMLTSAAELLYLSYPLADEEGRALVPSELIKRMKKLFPELQEEIILLEPLDGRALDYVTHPRRTLSQLAVQLRAWKRGYQIDPLWQNVYNWFVTAPSWREETRQILGGLFYQNQEQKLSTSSSRALYGKHLKASISRLEKYQACPFSHFTAYGLKLQERAIFRLEAPDIGQLFHSALDRMTARLQQQNKDWRDLEQNEVEQLSTEVVEELAPEFQKQILFSSKRLQYIGHKLKNVITRAGTVLSQHARRSAFTPIGTEVFFAADGAIPSLTFTLANGCTLELIGRIDRVDQAVGSRGLLLRIIDYKSSVKSLNLAEVYYGLALQMLTYLDVVVSNAEGWLGEPAFPAGMLYFHVHNAMIHAKSPLSQEEMDKKLLASYKMKGLLLADVDSIQLMDQQLTTKHSEIIPVGLKADGGFYANSSVITEGQLEHLRGHVRNTIQTIGTEITDGVVEIAPYQLKKKTPCSYCIYKPVCQFDTLFEGNLYRKLNQMSKEDIWSEIGVKEGIGDEQNSSEARGE